MLRRSRLPFAITAALAAVAVLAPGAGSDHGRGLIVYASRGDLVLTNGAPFQCLGFGPLRPPLQNGDTGVVCFKGPPRKKDRGSWAVWMHPSGDMGAKQEIDGNLARIFGETTIKRTKRLPSGHSLQRVGTGIFCKYGRFNPRSRREKAVVCFRLRPDRRWIPGSAVVGLTETEAMFGKTTASGNVAWETTLPHK